MLSPQKADLLKAFLAGLPESIGLRLAKAVEVDRLTGGNVLPHDLILDALRPALRNARRSDRIPIPQRLFYQPFADLLTEDPRKEKRKGRIARSSVLPVWNWLSETLAPLAVKDYMSVIKQAVLGLKPDEAKAHAAGFWILAADTLRTAIESDRKEARLALGDDLILADAEEMLLLLGAGSEIAEIQERLPCGTAALTDDTIWALRRIYDRLVQTLPDAAPYVAVVAMGRLERPWEALKLPLQISRQTSDTLISHTDMGLAGEVLFSDLEVHSTAIRVIKHPTFEPDELATHVAVFSRLSNGLVQEIDLHRGGVWHERMMKDRTAVTDTMESLMERAPREIIATLPVHKTGSYGGGPKAPNISRAADCEKVERGLRYARLLAACRPSAAAASFGAAHKDAFDEACRHLKGYSDDIVRELRATEGAKQALAEQYFKLAVAFTAILFSEEEAELLRRRGRAALADGNAAAA